MQSNDGAPRKLADSVMDRLSLRYAVLGLSMMENIHALVW